MKTHSFTHFIVTLMLGMNLLSVNAQRVLVPDFQPPTVEGILFRTQIQGLCQEEFICKGRTSTNGENKVFTDMEYSVFGSPLYLSFNIEYKGTGYLRFAVVDRFFNLEPIASSIESKGYLHLSLDTISKVPIPGTPNTVHSLTFVFYVVDDEHKDTHIASVDQLFSNNSICMPLNGDLSFALQAMYQEPQSIPEIDEYFPEPVPNPTDVNQSYIRTRTMTNSSGSTYTERLDYFDGLGRNIQTVQTGITPARGDLATMQQYDIFGRESRVWLPVNISRNNGSYVHPDSIISKATKIYDEDSNAYKSILYQESPLNIIESQYGAGEDWYKKRRSVKTNHFSNTIHSDSLNCFDYEIMENSPGDTVLIINNIGYYPANELFVTRVEDEDHNSSFKFENKIGQTLLTRQIINDTKGKRLFDTYYIYDTAGNLRAVIPPMAADEMKTNSSWSNESSDIIRNYAYLYKYDNRNRCIAKRLPGTHWMRYIYDKAGRIILTQDGEQLKRNEWTFSIPDASGRVVLTGICVDNSIYSVNSLIDEIVMAEWNPKSDKAQMGYTITGINISSPIILTANYYDNYEYRTIGGFSNSNLSYTNSGIDADYLTRYGDDTPPNVYKHKGLLTGTATLTLSSKPYDESSFIYASMYYDFKKRLIQSKETNTLGGIDALYMAYNFIGNLTKKEHVHSVTGSTPQIEIYNYTYDHAERLVTTTHQLNSGPIVTLINNEYDELGRLICNKRNGVGNLKTEYTYNVRSWTKSIRSPLFSQILYYNDSRANGTNVACYNGNISGIDWKVVNDKDRGYNFSYDNLSRLTGASYLEGNASSDKFSTSYSYDKHGNMLSLNRRGNVGTSTYGVVDDLTLIYNGNQLVSVEDKGTNPTLSMSMDFKDGSHGAVEYSYDGNGNQTKDLNKGISKIEYNILNLPQRITFNGANNPFNEYVYSSGGRKLSVIHKSSIEKRTDYVGNMIYENGSLKRVLVDGGYIEGGIYYFYLQDHLGNNRVVAKSDGTVVQTTHYYPYGMSFAESTFADQQPYKYNGKELDTENGLNLYDYGARQMETILGRFTTMDRFSEKYYSLSPYQYGANNPINNLDINGDSIWFSYKLDDDGKVNNITMHVTGKVLNDTEDDVDLQAAVKGITKALRRTYKGKIDGISFNTDIQLTAANNMDDIKDSDHLFVLTDKIHQPKDGEIFGISNNIGGKVSFINAEYFSGWYDKLLGSRNYGAFTAAHEFGHLSGLDHSKSPINVMRSSGMFFGINENQLKAIYGKWKNKNLNLGTNYIIMPPNIKRPNTWKASPIVKPY